MRNPTHGSDASIAVGSVAIATLAWRHQGVLRLTAIAKASFAFAVDGPLSRVEPEPIVVEEVHHDRNPMKSTWRTPDLVPYLRRADVLLTGTAFVTPGGDGAIRLGIFDGNAARLHKTALLRPASGAAQVPLRAEHAYGGQGFADNPLGTGRSSAPPSLVDAGDPQRAALFGPLGQFWPTRKRLRGAHRPPDFAAARIAELPDDFDFEFLQAAPPDQRVAYLAGDEWIVMDGLHRAHPRVRMRLPGARGLARIHGLADFGVPEGQLMPLHADTLRIDTDDERCSLTFRGTFELADEAALDLVQVALGVEQDDEPLLWPMLPPRASQRPAAPTPAGPAPTPSFAATMALDGEGLDALDRATLPFDAGRPAPAASGRAGAPHATPLPVERFAGTMALSPEEMDLAVRKPAVPFGVAPRAPEPPPPPFAAPLAPALGASLESPWARGVAHAGGPAAAPALLGAPMEVPKLVAPSSTRPEVDEPGEVPLEQLAAITAVLSERRASRADVLAAHALTEVRWVEVERRWSALLAEEEQRGGTTLRDAYDDAFVAAWEAQRGALAAADYARLVAATELGTLAGTLEAVGVRRTTWARVRRVWAKRLAHDRALATTVERELARLRRR